MFSLIRTALENGLEPYKYLTWLIKMEKDADLEDAAIVQVLLPWDAPEEGRVHQGARKRDNETEKARSLSCKLRD